MPNPPPHNTGNPIIDRALDQGSHSGSTIGNTNAGADYRPTGSSSTSVPIGSYSGNYATSAELQADIAKVKKEGYTAKEVTERNMRFPRFSAAAKRKFGIKETDYGFTSDRDYVNVFGRTQKGYSVGYDGGYTFVETGTKRTSKTNPTAVPSMERDKQRQIEKDIKKEYETSTGRGRIESTLKKLGLKIFNDKDGNIIYKDKNRRNIIANVGYNLFEPSNIVIASGPLSSKINYRLIPTIERQRQAQEKESQKRLFNFQKGMPKEKLKVAGNILGRLASQPLEFIKSAVRGTRNMAEYLELSMGQQVKNAFKATSFETMLNGGIISKNKNEVAYTATVNNRLVELLNNPDTKTAGIVAALGGVGATGRLGAFAVEGIGALFTGQQLGATIKDPSLENIGGLAFVGSGTAMHFLNTVRKVLPSTRPTIQNAKTMEIALKQKLEKWQKISRNPKGYNVRAIREVRREIPKLKNAIREIQKARMDKNIVQAANFNAKLSAKYLIKYQNAYKTLFHISGEAKINKLTGQIMRDIIKKEQVGKLAGKFPLRQKNILKDFEAKKAYQAEFLNQIKKRNGVVYGGKAIQLQTSTLRRLLKGRSKSKDFDIFMKDAKRNANSIKDTLNKKFNTDLFKTKQAVNKATTKLYYGKTQISDLTEISQAIKELGKLEIVKTKAGLRVLSKKQLLKGKLLAIIDKQAEGRKFTKDVKDINIITNGKLKLKDIFQERKNPRDIFEIIETPEGAGKSRKMFKEFFFYTDVEAAKGYGYGKKYSLLEFKEKINKYSKGLQNLVKKGLAGKLSNSQKITLRKRLVAYTKSHPEKFRIGTRTLSMGFGESEFTQYLGKFKRIGKYRIFDNEFNDFMEMATMSKNTRAAKISFLQKALNAYKKNPFTRLKYRLTNPDLLLSRKYLKLIKKDIDLSKPQKLKIMDMIKKVFSGKKAGFKLTPEERALSKVFKDTSKLTLLQKQILSIAELRRRIVKPSDMRELGNIRVPARERVISLREAKEIRRIIEVPRRVTDRVLRRNPERILLRNRVPIRNVLRARTPSRTRTPTRIREPSRVRTPSRTRTPTRIREPSRVRTPSRTRTPTRIRTPTRLRTPVRVPPTRTPPPPRRKEHKHKLGKPSYDLVHLAKVKRKFIYLADLLSILYGRVATSRQARALKQVGRLFTGLEARPTIG